MGGATQPQQPDRSPVSQSVSRSLGAEASHQASHPSHCQLIFWGGGRIIHLDGTLPHPTTPLRLMETDIRKNVRECVRSSEKVRLDVCACVCVFGCESCQGFWKMKHQAGRRGDVLSLVLIAAFVLTGDQKDPHSSFPSSAGQVGFSAVT